MFGWSEPPTGSYVHHFTPLQLQRNLDALAGLKCEWADMCGSPIPYPTTWQQAAPTLYTSGSFTLGASTALSKSGAGKILHAFFGMDEQDDGVTFGSDEPWIRLTHPTGCGVSWAIPDDGQILEKFLWPGQAAGPSWTAGPAPAPMPTLGLPWLGGLPSPISYPDPHDEEVPAPWRAAPEEGGVFGWFAPPGVPSAHLPPRTL